MKNTLWHTWKWDEKRRLWIVGLSRFALFVILCGCALLAAAVTQIDLTSQVKNILPSANGGSGSAYFGVSGPTALRTYTFRDASATIMDTGTNVLATQMPALTGDCTTTAGAVSTTCGSAIARTGTDINTSNQVTATHLGSPMPVNQGGTGSTTGFSAAGIVALFTGCSGSQYLGADGNCHTSGSTINFADDETPSGTVNGLNTTFTLAHTPAPAAGAMCFKNGQKIEPSGSDFTLATATITMVSAPKTGDVLNCSYRY